MNTVLWFWACVAVFSGQAYAAYYGKSLGRLSEFHHGVSGHVYAVDGRTLFIKDFTYDGEGPAAFFYVGNTKTPNNNGALRLRDERGSAGVLKRYRKKDITLSLPEGKTLNSIKWFSVWCDEFSVNFGDVKIPRNFDFPKPQKISGLAGVHAVSSDPIVIVDAQTLLIPNFSYDGEAPDAKFWVGRGDKPSPQGVRIPDENGKVTPLRKYDHKTIVLTLPGDLTIFDIGHFGVWCEAFTVDFGHIQIPEVTNVPPSLKMLGVSPQSKLNCEVLYDDLAFEVRWAVAGESVVIQLVAKLEDGEYMSFGISGDDKHTQMVGSDVTVAWVDKSTLKGYAYDYYLDAKSQCAGTRGSCPDESLAEKTNSVRLLNAAMVNGYSIVTYQRPLRAADELDKAVKSDKPQPIVWAVGPLNSRQEVSYHTHFTKGDRFLDFGRAPAWNCPMPEMDDGMEDLKQAGGTRKPTKVNSSQYLVETSGNKGKNKQASDDYDSDISESGAYKNQGNRRTNNKSVPTPKPVAQHKSWEIPSIKCNEPDDGVFYAQMGPTGGKQGYSAITGHVGWGIAWYINGLLIPEINVVRGKTYTFVVEGGADPNVPARYHPFYITDDPVGGYEHKTDEERSDITIYSGIRQTRNGQILSEGVGRLCYWTPDNEGPEADEYASFGAYQRSLTLKCDEGEPGVITWTPDRNTPNTVYYQCFTHRYLGWKINVLDSCDITEGEESQKHEVYEPFEDEDEQSKDGGDLVSKPSIRVNTRVKPDVNFLLEQDKDSNKTQGIKNGNIFNHNINAQSENRVIIREINAAPNPDDILTGEVYGAITPDIKKSSPDSRPDYDFPFSNNQFKEVIENVEKYESNIRNSNEDFLEHRPIYHHSPMNGHIQQLLSKNDHINLPVRGNDEGKNGPSHAMMNANQKPMTLQTFMRPHSKPMMTPNIFFRRPNPMDMRVRRPGMPKPIIGVPPRLAHPNFMMGQQLMSSQKKPIFKMPPMNRPPMNNVGRPPMMPMKPPINNGNHNKVGISNNQGNKTPSPVIMGKPNLMSQTLTLGQPTLIGQQFNKNQPPINGDSIFQQTITNSYLNKPGQIIMGKPMDNPLPLDQQMIQTSQQIQYTTVNRPANIETHNQPTHKLDIKPVYEIETSSKVPNVKIIPSELSNSEILDSPKPAEIITMRPAVNTGFKPDSVVIEGGFKPIIREPLLSGQDRITDYDSEGDEDNRRHDTENEETEQVEESISRVQNNDYYEKQLTESFEPMFIPSPPDRFQGKNLTVPIEKGKLHYVDIGPRPVYIKPIEDIFEKSDAKQPEDMATAADRIDAYYLPPDVKNSAQQKPSEVKPPVGAVVSYDGQSISDATLTSASKNDVNKIYSAKLSSNSELLTSFPQFGPFKGEIPAAIRGQLNAQGQAPAVTNSHGLPSDYGASKVTKLKLISTLEMDDKEKDDLEYEASENEEVADEADEDYDKEDARKVKRSAHTDDRVTMKNNNTDHDHSAHDHSDHDHSGHDHSIHDHSDHDHSHHDHSHHDHGQGGGDLKLKSNASHSTISFVITLPLLVLIKYLL